MKFKSGLSEHARLFCDNKDGTRDNIRANILRCDDKCVCVKYIIVPCQR